MLSNIFDFSPKLLSPYRFPNLITKLEMPDEMKLDNVSESGSCPSPSSLYWMIVSQGLVEFLEQARGYSRLMAHFKFRYNLKSPPVDGADVVGDLYDTTHRFSQFQDDIINLVYLAPLSEKSGSQSQNFRTTSDCENMRKRSIRYNKILS